MDKEDAKKKFLEEQSHIWDSMESKLNSASTVSLGKAHLVFLNEIEKNTTKAADATVSLLTMPDMIVNALERQTIALAPKSIPDPPPLDLSPVVESSLNMSNTVLTSGNKIENKISEQTKVFTESLHTVVGELTKMNEPKKWRFTVDRNFTTGKIQSIEAEIIKEV